MGSKDTPLTSQGDDNPLEQLIELFVYAPIGMLYEYPDVLPRLIKRGRSQVQLAKFFGQMAAKQGGAAIPESAMAGAGTAGAAGAQAADAVAKVAARFITELGAQVGLAPPSSGATSPPAAEEAERPAESSTGADGAVPAAADEALAGNDARVPAKPARAKTARLPIAGYDDLTAKEIIGLLEDLTIDQLQRVRKHEASNRNRKTVLAKIDRLVP